MIQVDLLFKLAGLGVAVAVISQVLNRADWLSAYFWWSI